MSQFYPDDWLADIDDLPPFLSACAPRVRHLGLEASQDFIQLALYHMIAHGAAGSTKALNLILSEDSGAVAEHIEIPDSIEDFEEHPADVTEAFWSSIQYLELHRITLPWHSAAYHGLIELHLDLTGEASFPGYFPTFIELQGVLGACPMLNAFSFHHQSTLDLQHFSFEPVQLLNLRSLTFRSWADSGCPALLALLSSPQGPLEANLTVYPDPEFLEELESFFRRSNIVKLGIRLYRSMSWFTPLTRELSRLESLTLYGCGFDDGAFVEWASMSSHSQNPPLWPRLHTLRLVYCHIDEDRLKYLIREVTPFEQSESTLRVLYRLIL